jgi:misacylated tRNA(Ala) deacylase
MSIYLCHEQPDLYEHDGHVVAARPGAVMLSRSAFHPGGGGQVGDRGALEWAGGRVEVTGVQVDDDQWWHVLADPEVVLDGPVSVSIDRTHRHRVASLHTTSHVLNAFVFDEFAGALVTGAQINGDGTGRMDFDLPEVDNERVRALEGPVHDVIRRGLAVRSVYVDASDPETVAGLVRSLSVAPPATPDGRLRIIDIEGLDRQACGGTHLTNTGASPEIRITKVENKGRRNRRVRFQFA